MRLAPCPRGLALVAALAALLGACSQNLVQTPSRNLDRPSDIAFACLSTGDGGTTPTVVAPSQCAIDPDAGLPSATLYGFVTNTARGEVALVDLGYYTSIHLVDLDLSQPGYGFIPVGRLPARIAGSSDGCRVATANAGTCDLSVIDTEAAITPALATGTISETTGQTTPRGVVAAVVPRTAAGPLGARPREIAFVAAGEPSTCAVDRAYQAVVTFPACSLVALVELPTGRILDSVKLTATGLVAAGDSPWCPSECGTGDRGGAPDAGPVDAPAADAGGDDAAADAGTGDAAPDAGVAGGDAGAADDAGAAGSDGGAPAPSGGAAPQAGGLALSADGTRVYIAADDQPLVYAAALADGRLQPLTGAVRLDATKAGVRRLRLSPPFAFGEVTQSFLYAFAGDSSVHVVLARETRTGTTTDTMVECDANADSRIWNDPQGTPPAEIPIEKRGCIRLDDNLPRAPLAKTPGIVPVRGVPKDVAFHTITSYQLAERSDSTTPGPANLKGTFGWLATSRGTSTVINILPDREAGESGYAEGSPYRLRPDPSLLLAHRLRNLDDITSPITTSSVATLTQNAGPPRVYAMTRLSEGVTYTGLDVFRVDDAHNSAGELVQSVEETAQNCKSKYEVCFPDVFAVNIESWTISQHTTLPNSLRATGNIEDTGWAVTDQSQVFCDLGTQPGDLFIVGGCVVQSQCASGETCVVNPVASSTVSGLCFPLAEAEAKRTECDAFLSTLRRYRVARVYADRLELVPAYEIRAVPGGCDPSLGTAETERCNAPAPTDLPAPDETVQHYVCEPVPWPDANAGECIRDCEGDRLCGEGYRCDAQTRRCVAGPPLTGEAKQACLPELLNYALQVGDGYAVYGNYSGTPVTGLLHRVVRAGQKDATDHYPCVDSLTTATDPREQRRLVLMQGRIPLLPPLCANHPPGDWPPDPNPCRVEGVDEEYLLDEGSTTPIRDGKAIKAYYANPSVNISFLLGALDDSGQPVVNPPPTPSYYIQVDVAGWFQPYNTSIASFLPETLATAPDGYIYIVDSGLDVYTSGLRGQLLRIDPSTGAIDPNFIVR
jgi:hypothetical protein